MRCRTALVLWLCLLIWSAVGTHAQITVVVPNTETILDGDSENRFPFAPLPTKTAPRYQQAYDALDLITLTGTDLTEIAFRLDAFHRLGDVSAFTYPSVRVELSSRGNLVDNLDNDFENNHGADRTVVFEGPVNLPFLPCCEGISNGFRFTIPFDTPFPYTGGDLLLDLTIDPPTAPEFYLDGAWRLGLPGADAVSRVFETSEYGIVIDSAGLVTRFTGATPPTCVLSITGSCPGEVTISVDDATPLGQVVILYSPRAGTVAIPDGFACSGTVLGLGVPVLVGRVITADASGFASLVTNVPPGACGYFLQALDLATCCTSEIEQLR